MDTNTEKEEAFQEIKDVRLALNRNYFHGYYPVIIECCVMLCKTLIRCAVILSKRQ